MIKKAARTLETGSAQPPAHELVYQALRERLLFGELAPGQAVTIQGLTRTVAAGMTPVRCAVWSRSTLDTTVAGATVYRLKCVPAVASSLLEEASNRHAA